MYAAVRVIAPDDADLLDRIAHPAGQQEHLAVEGEALRAELGEYPLARPPREELEPALRVVDVAQHEPAAQAAEELTEGVAVPRLVLADVRLVHVPRADDDVEAGRQGRQELLDLPDRRGLVGVGHQKHVALGPPDAAPHAVALAAVDPVPQELNRYPVRVEPIDRLRRGVGRAVVHHDYLGADVLPLEVVANLPQPHPEPPRLVKGRNDDGQERLRRIGFRHLGFAGA